MGRNDLWRFFRRAAVAGPDRRIAQLDRALDDASRSTDETERRKLFGEAQRLIAEQVPYISLWCKTNAVVAQRDLANLRVAPTADFSFLKDVERLP